MLHAESAEALFLSTSDNRKALRVMLPAGGRLQRQEVGELGVESLMWAKVIEDEQPALLPRTSKDAAMLRFLHQLEYRDAVIAPLRGEAGVVGMLLVGNRL